MPDDGITIDSAARVIYIARSYAAAVDRAWRAWTEPDQLAKWWGPEGWTTTVHEMDVRPGGKWRQTMAPDDGSSEPVRTVATYRGVARHALLSFVDTFAGDDWTPEGSDFLTDVTFQPTATGTRVSIAAGFGDDESLRRAVELGMAEGYLEALLKLGRLLEH